MEKENKSVSKNLDRLAPIEQLRVVIDLPNAVGNNSNTAPECQQVSNWILTSCHPHPVVKAGK